MVHRDIHELTTFFLNKKIINNAKGLVCGLV